MKSFRINSQILAALLTITALTTICCASPLHAGETAIYLKPGYFSWEEKLNGSKFIDEKGIIYAIGVTHSITMTDSLHLDGGLEVWGGTMDYEGHNVTNTVEINSDTNYLGTREEITIGNKFQVSDAISVDPFAGIGHKYWMRSRSSETWNMIYGKAGMNVSGKINGVTTFAKGGITLPLLTRCQVSLSNAGYEDVVLEPKSKIGGFVESGVKFSSWGISLGYEFQDFGKSDNKPTRSTNLQSGSIIENNNAFQPDSKTSTISLTMSYTF